PAGGLAPVRRPPKAAPRKPLWMLGHSKAPLPRVFDPVARLLLRMGARPNHLTVLGLGVSVAAAYVFSVGRLRWAAVLLAVAGLFDFFDGAVARLAGS